MQIRFLGAAPQVGVCLILLLAAARPEAARAARAKIDTRVGAPYLGAMVTDADTGMILFADQPDTPGYPASVLKVMDLLIILEKIKAGALKLTDPVSVTAESARIGGSQVYLKENESFTVDELLYALMVQSANDAATALAIHVAGSKDGFVELMNQQARRLGMRATQFHSIHGLPPGDNQQPDVTTARDLSRLARAVLAYPDTLRYTAAVERQFRAQPPFVMRNHNNLLGTYTGCDGLKTGYFRQAGYSIIATAQRGDTRIIAVLLGCPDKKTRDTKAAELLSKGFLAAPKKAPPAPAAAPPPALTNALTLDDQAAARWPGWLTVLAVAVLLVAGAGAYIAFKARRRNPMGP